MKCIYLLSMVLAVGVAVDYRGLLCRGRDQAKLDDLHIDKVMGEKDMLTGFMLCFLEEKPCVGVEAECKKYVRDSIETGCSRCTDEQKHIVRMFMKSSAEHLPELYERFKNHYDPEAKYIPVLAANIAHS